MQNRISKMIVVCLVAVCGAVNAVDLIPVARSSVSLEAKQVAASRSANDSFKTDWGSYDKKFERSRELAIEVKNLSSSAAPILVARMYWIGKLIPKNNRVMLRYTEREIAIGANGKDAWADNSGNIKGADMNLKIIGVREVDGARIDGWVVTLEEKATGKLVAIRASDSPLEILARTPDALRTMQVLEQ